MMGGSIGIDVSKDHLDVHWLPALVAARFNPDLKCKYQAMVAAGKPPKVALTALMRKLIELANALVQMTGNGCKKGLDQDGYSKRARNAYPARWCVAGVECAEPAGAA